MDGLPTRMAPAPVMAEWYRERCQALVVANAELVRRGAQQRVLIERQADRIDLLERLLTPPGPRAMARLARSPWWVRLARALGLVA